MEYIRNEFKVAYILFLTMKIVQLTSDKNTRSGELTLVAAIDTKLREMKNYLQDNEEASTEPNSIINLKARADSLESFLRKYKKKRESIEKALEKETMPKRTRQYIVKAMKDILCVLEADQCPLKTVLSYPKYELDTLILMKFVNAIKFNDKRCYIDNQEFSEETCAIFKAYKVCVEKGNADCNFNLDISTMGSNLDQDNKFCTLNNKKISVHECTVITKKILEVLGISNLTWSVKDTDFSFNLNLFKQNWSNIFPFLQKYVSSRNKIKCRINNENESKSSNKDACEDFRLCSKEFKEFLGMFHDVLNNTGVSALKDYANLYANDTLIRREEKYIILSAIRETSDAAERKLVKVYKKEIEKLNLDRHKDKKTNIDSLKEFVIHMVNRVKKVFVKPLEKHSNVRTSSLTKRAKNDLQQNLEAKFKILEKDVVTNICLFFITCNGKVKERKTNSSDPIANSKLNLGQVLKNMLGINWRANMRRNYGDEIENTKANFVIVTRSSIGTRKMATIPKPTKRPIWDLSSVRDESNEEYKDKIIN